jgi:hypothetical protein
MAELLISSKGIDIFSFRTTTTTKKGLPTYSAMRTVMGVFFLGPECDSNFTSPSLLVRYGNVCQHGLCKLFNDKVSIAELLQHQMKLGHNNEW